MDVTRTIRITFKGDTDMTRILLTATVLSLTLNATADAAGDFFIKLDGIEGESQSAAPAPQPAATRIIITARPRSR